MFDASEHENSLNDLIRYVHDLEYGATARNSIHTNWILLVSQQWNKDLKTRCECGLENKLTQRYDMHFTHIFDAKMFYALVHFWVHNIICLSYCHSFQMPWYKRKMIFCNFYILQLDLTSSSETNHFFVQVFNLFQTDVKRS